MDRLLKYEPDKAVMLWHQIHKRRRRDHQAGKGDYSDSNITYKMLANRGLFPAISEVSGEYIAGRRAGKTAQLLPPQEQIEEARRQLGLKHPVRVLPTFSGRGGYAGISRDPITGQQSHLVYVNPEKAHGPRNWALWHELGHAQRIEQGGEFTPNNELSDEEYWQSPNEQHAEGVANQYADHDLWRASATNWIVPPGCKPWEEGEIGRTLTLHDGTEYRWLDEDEAEEKGEVDFSPDHATVADYLGIPLDTMEMGYVNRLGEALLGWDDYSDQGDYYASLAGP
jgi:hypothetical protein